jgi:alcohol dehydrogenase (NADP+)
MKLSNAVLPLAALASAQLHNAEQQPLDINPVHVEQETSTPGPLTLDAIPLLGFGTWNLKANCTEAVAYAIEIGYRHIDCAKAYGNEQAVGQGIAQGLAKTGLRREDLWITSKLWNDA